MARRTSHNRNNHSSQYNSQDSRPSRNQLGYGDDTSAYDDEFSSPRSAQSQSDRQRRTSTRSDDENRHYREPHGQQPFRPDRNQLGYGDDSSAYDDDFWSPRSAQSGSGRQRGTSTRSERGDRDYRVQHNQKPYRTDRNQLSYGDDISAYDDDYWSNGQQRSGAARQRKTSAHSVEEDIDYWSEQNFGRGQFNEGERRSYDNIRNENARQSERYSDQQRHVNDNRQWHENMDDLRRSRYQGDGRWGVGGESRRGHYTEDASFYEYRVSRHNPNARRSAQHDMDREDAGYFDRDNRNANWNVDRRWNRHNISDEDYYRQEQRSQSRKPHPNDRWRDYDEPHHRPHDSRDRNRNRKW